MAAQVIESLENYNIQGIWFMTGGDPKQTEIHAQKMQHIMKHLHAKSPTYNSHIKFLNQKPVIGFCYALPIMYYLGARGLA